MALGRPRRRQRVLTKVELTNRAATTGNKKVERTMFLNKIVQPWACQGATLGANRRKAPAPLILGPHLDNETFGGEMFFSRQDERSFFHLDYQLLTAFYF